MPNHVAKRIEKAIAAFAEAQKSNTRELVLHRWLLLTVLGALAIALFLERMGVG